MSLANHQEFLVMMIFSSLAVAQVAVQLLWLLELVLLLLALKLVDQCVIQPAIAELCDSNLVMGVSLVMVSSHLSIPWMFLEY